MALTLFEDFEDGTTDVNYPGKTGTDGLGNSWSVNADNRSTGLGPPKYRPSPDTTNNIQASGAGGSKAIGMQGNSAFAVNVQHWFSEGLGCHFYSNTAGPGGGSASSGQVSIDWSDLYVNQGGLFSVRRIGAVLTLRQTWFLDAEFEEDIQTVTVTDFLPVEGLSDTGLWLEVRFTQADGWLVRNSVTDAVIASGAYLWTIPPRGVEFDLSYLPNSFGPAGAAGTSRAVMDDIYGYPGRDRTLVQVVRQYPRDDEHGYSGGRRLYPPPRLARIIGRQT